MDGSNSGSADTGLALSWPHGTVNLGILLGGLTPNQSITASEARKKSANGPLVHNKNLFKLCDINC